MQGRSSALETVVAVVALNNFGLGCSAAALAPMPPPHDQLRDLLIARSEIRTAEEVQTVSNAVLPRRRLTGLQLTLFFV